MFIIFEFKVKNISISLSLLQIIYYSRKNSYFNKIKLHFYVFNINIIDYKYIFLAFIV